MTLHHALTGSTGAPGTTLALADAYRALGHDVVGISTFDDLPDRLPEQAKQLAFPFVASARAVRLAATVDVVDASTADLWPLLLLRRARRRRSRRRPVIITRSHGLEHASDVARRALARAGELELSQLYRLYHGGLYLREVACTLRRADAALFLNREDRDYAVARLAVRPDRAHIVFNGLSPAFLGLGPPCTDDDAVQIVQVGSFSSRKGVSFSVPALERVLASRPAARVSFLGAGVAPDTVLQRFSPEVRAQVTVVERYENERLPALLSRSAISIFPSVSEGFGKALLETMACGLAPIATATPGPRELVDDGVNGLLVPVADADALAEAMLRLVDDAAVRRRLAAAAQSSAQTFSWSHTASQRLALFERLCFTSG
ncbi:MAG: hypothetical protein QOE11_3660 [Solirubrobacteraceae bacterium]|jgi:glycosyltransferase involved in cell wall biosynthesis|nr:hypothetical protein [Solirubrobacteraceae bacterium]